MTTQEDAPVFVQTGGSAPVVGDDEFIDISSDGVDIGNHGDDIETTVELPFPVTFYGQEYTDSILVSGNGWVSFDGYDHSYSNDPLSEVGRPMGDEHVVFFETARIEQHIEALAGGELALGVLGIDALLAAAKPRFLTSRVERRDDLVHEVSTLTAGSLTG